MAHFTCWERCHKCTSAFQLFFRYWYYHSFRRVCQFFTIRCFAHAHTLEIYGNICGEDFHFSIKLSRSRWCHSQWWHRQQRHPQYNRREVIGAAREQISLNIPVGGQRFCTTWCDNAIFFPPKMQNRRSKGWRPDGNRFDSAICDAYTVNTHISHIGNP